jgi:hypothetical protein
MSGAPDNPKFPHKALFYLSGGRGPAPSSKEAFRKMCAQRTRQQKLDTDFKAAKKEAVKEAKQVAQEMKKELREKWGPTGLVWLVAEPKEKRRLMKQLEQSRDGADGGGGDLDAAPAPAPAPAPDPEAGGAGGGAGGQEDAAPKNAEATAADS